MTFAQKLERFLTSKEFPLDCLLHPGDGSYIRISRKGKESGWFTSYRGKGCYYAKCGDWKTGEIYEFRAKLDGSEPSDDDIASLKEDLRKKEMAQWKAAATISEEIWGTFSELGESEYLVNKKCGTGLFGCRIGFGEKEKFVAVPLRDVEGKLWGFQKIYSSGFKSFPENVKISSNFHLIGNLPQYQHEPLYVAEGLATGASIHLATKAGVVVVFSRVNILPVVKALKEKYKNLSIVIAADNDHKTPSNPGLTDAKRASELCGTGLVYPEGIEGTDFNDLHVERGLESVGAALLRARKGEEELPTLTPTDGTRKAPSEYDVACAFLAYIQERGGDFLVSQSRLFKWLGTHWKKMEDSEIAQIKIALGKISGLNFSHAKLEACYKQFIVNVTSHSASINPYSGHVGKVNLLDGTLHLVQDGVGAMRVEHRPHAKEDGMPYVLPFSFATIQTSTNPSFDAFLRATFKDREESLATVQEMFATALFPFFGRLFFLHGPSGTGKTTLARILGSVLPPDLVSASDPTTWGREFYLQTMVGKVLNICNDISYNTHIEDRIAKSIVDGTAMSVNVKFESPIQSVLPKVHIFTCNGLPKTLEGANEVYLRRMSFVEMPTQVDRRDMDFFLVERILADGKEGIFNFAYQGLLRLLANGGKFTETAQEVQTKKEWEAEQDSFSLFLGYLKEGEIEGELRSNREEGRAKRLSLTCVGEEEIKEYYSKPVQERRVRIYLNDLYCYYRKWVGQNIVKMGNGRDNMLVLPQKEFGTRLEKSGYKISLKRLVKNGYRRRIVYGIGFDMKEYDNF